MTCLFTAGINLLNKNYNDHRSHNDHCSYSHSYNHNNISYHIELQLTIIIEQRIAKEPVKIIPGRDSNPPVLAGNLPLLGIISVLPFSLQNLPFYRFLQEKVKFVILIPQVE